MSQMIDAISFCHEKKYHFDIGSLNEFNIYLSETLDHCFIDPGFFHDEDDEIPRYYTENEFGDEKTTKSEQDDIFAIGMVFFRLITLLSIEEIEEMYEKEIKPKQRKKSTKRRSWNILLEGVFSGFESNEKPLKYLANFRYQMFKKDQGYNEDLLVLVLQMLDPVELKRPTAEKVSETLQLIKKQSLSRPSFLGTQENSLTKITEGWSFEQKAIMSDVLYRQFLKDFLRIEFCVETLLFFEDISKFKELKGTERIEKANEIILSYLSRKSTLQVNVNAKQIKNISSNIKIQLESNGSIDDSIFDDSLGHVINTMMCDNYPRFEKSNIFENMEIVRKSEKIQKKKSILIK